MHRGEGSSQETAGGQQPAEPAPWLDLVRRIVAEVSRSDATELEVSHGSFRVMLKRQLAARTSQPAAARPMSDQTREQHGHAVSAPLTGVFYRAPSPNAPSFVEIGDLVEPTTTVGLIEAMKVFNEVAAEVKGRVTAIIAQSGQLVHAGDPLLLVEVMDETTDRTEASG